MLGLVCSHLLIVQFAYCLCVLSGLTWSHLKQVRLLPLRTAWTCPHLSRAVCLLSLLRTASSCTERCVCSLYGVVRAFTQPSRTPRAHTSTAKTKTLILPEILGQKKSASYTKTNTRPNGSSSDFSRHFSSKKQKQKTKKLSPSVPQNPFP